MAQKVENPDRALPDITKYGDVEGEKELELQLAGTNLTRLPTFSKEVERRVRSKLDWNIIPLVMAVYMLSVLDRSNVGNARISGMQTDLHLTSSMYSWLLTIFYIPCIHLNAEH